MNMIRTTIALREDIYDEVRRLMVAKRMTMSEIVNAKLTNTSFGLDGESVERKIKESRGTFEKLAKKGKKGVDVVKAVREMRDQRI